MKKLTTLIVSLAIISSASFANSIDVISYKQIQQGSGTTQSINIGAHFINLD